MDQLKMNPAQSEGKRGCASPRLLLDLLIGRVGACLVNQS